jgi:hypothetical protein
MRTSERSRSIFCVPQVSITYQSPHFVKFSEMKSIYKLLMVTDTNLHSLADYVDRWVKKSLPDLAGFRQVKSWWIRKKSFWSHFCHSRESGNPSRRRRDCFRRRDGFPDFLRGHQSWLLNLQNFWADPPWSMEGLFPYWRLPSNPAGVMEILWIVLNNRGNISK